MNARSQPLKEYSGNAATVLITIFAVYVTWTTSMYLIMDLIELKLVENQGKYM